MPVEADIRTAAVRLAPGREALVVFAAADADPAAVARALALEPARALLVVNGSASALDGALAERLTASFAAVVGALSANGRLTVLSGGTDAGVFAALGRAIDGWGGQAVGVVPDGCVTWPGRAAGDADDAGDRVALEPHHSHAVLVAGSQWGQETAMMLGVAAAPAVTAPAVVLVAGGGEVTRREVLGHAAAGRPIVLLRGSGRLAEELAAAPDLDRALVDVVDLADGPDALVAAVRRRLGSQGGD